MKRIFTLLIAAMLIPVTGFTANVDKSGHITSDETWTADNDYYLDGYVFVDSTVTLTIEAGTVVRGYAGSVENASALIVLRGGKIIANGTAENPIVFTSEADVDLDRETSFRGEWGGVIILGAGTHNNPTDQNDIEGVPTAEGAYYGGSTADDNSGSLTYASIRHAGVELKADEEINGLTLGAVGSGTTIDHIEIVANDDDGIEWFGGSVSSKYLVVVDCADDSYDIDEGFNGYLQFIYTHQLGDGTGDNFGEHDGGPSSNRYGQPYARTIISNATYVGGGASAGDRVLTLRDFWSGEYHNSIFAEQAKGVRLEYVEEFTGGDLGGSFTQWKKGILKLENNIFQNIADGTVEKIFTVYSPTDDNDQPVYTIPSDSSTAFANYFATAGNTAADVGVSKDNPLPGGDVSGADFTSLDAWFDVVSYKGCFDPSGDDWPVGWTKTFTDPLVGIEKHFQISFESRVYPNPVSEMATISFDNPEGKSFSLQIYAINGQLVRSYDNIRDSQINIECNGMPTGIYTYKLSGANRVSTGKMIMQ